MSLEYFVTYVPVCFKSVVVKSDLCCSGAPCTYSALTGPGVDSEPTLDGESPLWSRNRAGENTYLPICHSQAAA